MTKRNQLDKQYILLFTFILLSIFRTNAQDISSKKIQMGIVLGSGLNMNQVNTKIVTQGKIGTELTVGMNFIKNFNANIGFNSGIEFDFSRFNYGATTSLFYYYSDNQIINKNKLTVDPNNTLYQLTERKYKAIYLSIPTMFVFRTDLIGYNRYFAKFGMKNSFVLKNTVDDNGFVNLTESTNSKMNIQKDLSIYKGAIGISAGTEWNYSGSSSIMFELGYYYGINNLHREKALTGDEQKNMTLFEKTEPILTDIQYSTIKSSQNQIALKISFLF
jgi:hypothetical protein